MLLNLLQLYFSLRWHRNRCLIIQLLSVLRIPIEAISHTQNKWTPSLTIASTRLISQCINSAGMPTVHTHHNDGHKTSSGCRIISNNVRCNKIKRSQDHADTKPISVPNVPQPWNLSSSLLQSRLVSNRPAMPSRDASGQALASTSPT